uniref:Uncharacterized protein n=1 Tax=Streptomyces avermitilis TaxID=33903 RepID=A0A499VT50_STRAX|nr:hypothetical protein SAVMC3_79370 [Streptomyces avermitilis]
MRELALDLGVNPNTVAAAYRTLRERGVIETSGRRGSRVRPKPATTGREDIRVEVPAGVRDVADGNPDPALLPGLAEAFAGAAGEADRAPVMYGEDAVEPELARLARAALDADGVPDGPLVVTSGSLDAIERVLAAHLKPGTRSPSRTPAGAACSTSCRRSGCAPSRFGSTAKDRSPTTCEAPWRPARAPSSSPTGRRTPRAAR